MSFEIEDFNPKNHDKYSPYLYLNLKRLTKRQFYSDPKVFVDRHGKKWFGVICDGDFFGAELMQYLIKQRRAGIEGCYLHLRGDLTELKNFWDDYRRYGRCAIDIEHEVDFHSWGNRYQELGNLRGCKWCGAQQKKVVREIVVHKTAWVNYKQPEVLGNECNS